MLLKHKRLEIKESSSKLSFTTTGGGSWAVWDRFISYNDEHLFHTGNICGTCAFFFRQVKDVMKYLQMVLHAIGVSAIIC